MHEWIILVGNQRVVVTTFGQLTTKTLQLTTKMMYLYIFLSRVKMTKSQGVVVTTRFLLVYTCLERLTWVSSSSNDVMLFIQKLQTRSCLKYLMLYLVYIWNSIHVGVEMIQPFKVHVVDLWKGDPIHHGIKRHNLSLPYNAPTSVRHVILMFLNKLILELKNWVPILISKHIWLLLVLEALLPAVRLL